MSEQPAFASIFEDSDCAPSCAAPSHLEASPGASSVSRRQFLALGAASAAALLLSSSPGQADLVRSLKGIIYLDPIITNFAFELEELQAEFFTRATLSDAYRGLQPREQTLFNVIANEDREHYEVLKMFRDRTGKKNSGRFESPNASSSRAPRIFNFPGRAFSSREGLLSVALDIKETAVFAYHGAVDLIDKDSLLVAAAIAGVDGRHLAMLREISGLDPVPSPFEASLPPQKAGYRLARYGFRGGGRNSVTNQPSP